MSVKRRTFLKGTMATSALGAAVGTGLLQPRAAIAAWSEKAFSAKKVDEAIAGLFGNGATKESGEIKLVAPDIAENGAVVPISVTTSLKNVETISILVEKNPAPLACSFNFSGPLEGYVSTRIKMGETSDVYAVVKAGGQVYSTKKTVKVTIGGCGG
ncbi:MAG: thiosulfate oxidation carrier protein SoxY [Gammaproteobacteria bacterium]|nr:thiosulfate oxidation carrier protein SoxY [Gammaproteobacteria bacterium]